MGRWKELNECQARPEMFGSGAIPGAGPPETCQTHSWQHGEMFGSSAISGAGPPETCQTHSWQPGEMFGPSAISGAGPSKGQKG